MELCTWVKDKDINTSPSETMHKKYKYKYHHLTACSRLGLVAVAQLVVHRTSKPKVAGSNPSRGQVQFFSTCLVCARFIWSSVNIKVI